jgi:hypothetical protein
MQRKDGGGGVRSGDRLAGSNMGIAVTGGRWRRCAARARAHRQGRPGSPTGGAPATVTGDGSLIRFEFQIQTNASEV